MVRGSVRMETNSAASAALACPTGKSPVTAGWSGLTSDVLVTQNYPSPGTNQWNFGFANKSQGGYFIDIYLICANYSL